jgi:hypothetical protein
MKTRRIVLLGGLIASALLAVFGDRSKPGEVILPSHDKSRSSIASVADGSRSAALDGPDGVSNPTVMILQDRSALAGGESTKGLADNVLFSAHSWTPPPPAPTATDKPTAPPLPFTYLGKEFEAGQWRVFLARESAVFIVKDNDVIDDRYRVEKITPSSVTVLYVPLNEAQQMSIQ